MIRRRWSRLRSDAVMQFENMRRRVLLFDKADEELADEEDKATIYVPVPVCNRESWIPQDCGGECWES